jgi:ABC transporter substrate binding protein (PQQ-dependent alcohol dehydrogenase system)
MQTIPVDNGVAGAKLAAQEVNVTGKFVGREYDLQISVLSTGSNVANAAKQLLAAKPVAIVADLNRADLLALADLPEAADDIILDVRTINDDLRQENCRQNVFHLLPSRTMRTDALAQFLVFKRWQRWFVLKGVSTADEAYVADVRRSAARFGGKVVEERTYSYDPGARRVDTGFQQIQTQMPLERETRLLMTCWSWRMKTINSAITFPITPPTPDRSWARKV